MKPKRIAVQPGLSVLDHPELLGASKDQAERVLPVLRELLARQKSKVADLLFGRAGDLWIRGEMRLLENSIIDEVEDPKLACDCLRLLHKSVTAWVVRNPQDIPFPRLYTLPKYSLNPLPANLRRVFNTLCCMEGALDPASGSLSIPSHPERRSRRSCCASPGDRHCFRDHLRRNTRHADSPRNCSRHAYSRGLYGDIRAPHSCRSVD